MTALLVIPEINFPSLKLNYFQDILIIIIFFGFTSEYCEVSVAAFPENEVKLISLLDGDLLPCFIKKILYPTTEYFHELYKEICHLFAKII